MRSHAGMNGGYALSRGPREITAFEVIHAIDGPLFITSCVTGTGFVRLDRQLHHQRTLARVNDSISEVLKNIRISDLADARASSQTTTGNRLTSALGLVDPVNAIHPICKKRQRHEQEQRRRRV